MLLFMTHKPVRREFILKKFLLLVGVGVLIFILLVLGFLLQPAYATPAETLAFAKDAIGRQQKIEEELRATYHQGNIPSPTPW
jgi:hypothetical protein